MVIAGDTVLDTDDRKVYAEFFRLNKVRDIRLVRVSIWGKAPLSRPGGPEGFRKLCMRAGIENFRFHDLRHDFCSRLVQAGPVSHVVAELAGHEDKSSTQHYAHLSLEMKRKVITALNGYPKTSAG